MMKKVIRGMLVFALACSMIGCSSKEDKKEEKTEFNVGEVATFKEVEYTVVAVERHQGTNQFSKPKEGKEFVTVHIKIENKSKEKISYNPIDWKMVNSNGQEEGYSVTGGMDTQIHHRDLTAAGKIEGTITYEQTIGDTGLKLNYYETMFSDKAVCSFIIN